MSCPTDNPVVLDPAVFAPSAADLNNIVNWGPTSTEGEVLLYSNETELNTFMLQNCSSLIEAEISQFWDYTDGYAMRLKYNFERSLADGVYAACLATPTE